VVAGGKGEPPFDEKGYKIIFAYSKGLPRDAVKICDEGQCLESCGFGFSAVSRASIVR
jgi:hypothetical protein